MVAIDNPSIVRRVARRMPIYWAYTRDNPSWPLMIVFARTMLGRRVERLFRRPPASLPRAEGSVVLDGLDPAAVVQRLVTDGVATGLQLPPEIVQSIHEFARTRRCFARNGTEVGFLADEIAAVNARSERDIISAQYFDAVEDCPAIVALRQDPGIRAIATAYLGGAVMPTRTRLWWNFPGARVDDDDLHDTAQDKYHFDMNAWRSVKFFFYLTPVDLDAGPHRCVAGTHRSRPLRQQLTLKVGQSLDELERSFAPEKFLTILGPAGSGFAEDPFVFHTGSRCRSERRLILELEFGVRPSSRAYHYGRVG
ncbi:phytanoyl-CoA dioxygenase family protein [Kaistia dalseonensis]|uniref:Phytanoyl-CoA dioxygenase n=1 Tax=Kaistia dalseonensis TaxID=410840 RepID=A0ABU0HDB1_9HYPH|nr:phytanoyl-CoA dioxygenase family protein [Kaistia dalseonensis]MCX5497667.1 phytanoyl-CoA dioxygenase family protein [Kaistia dalseonensis]MDQ0440311.1 hypothetical protein [Kaistia dalseonensis]